METRAQQYGEKGNKQLTQGKYELNRGMINYTFMTAVNSRKMDLVNTS